MIGHLFKAVPKIDANITAQYDVEQNLRSRTGKNNATSTGTITYTDTPAVGYQGGKYWLSAAVVTNSISIPSTVLRTANGSLEFAFSCSDVSTTNVILNITSASYSRLCELYVFAGAMYYFTNKPGATSSTIGLAVSNNTTYYIKLAWDTTSIYVYASTSPTLPSTPTATYTSPRFDVDLPTAVNMPAVSIQGPAGPINKYDAIKISNIKRTRFPTL